MALLYKTVCVLVSGPIRSGKTTFGNMLVSNLTEKGLNAEKFSFADPIKKLATYMGWNGVKDTRGRKLLQLLGTECGRGYNEDCWVSLVIDKTIPGMNRYPFDVIVIDDWRFPNEREYIERNILYDVYPVAITGRHIEDPNNGHASEISLPNAESSSGYYHSVVYNTDDIYALQNISGGMSVDLLQKYNKGVN